MDRAARKRWRESLSRTEQQAGCRECFVVFELRAAEGRLMGWCRVEFILMSLLGRTDYATQKGTANRDANSNAVRPDDPIKQTQWALLIRKCEDDAGSPSLHDW
jgi:hypothetical protein